jgi:hypothetical protein
MTVAEQLRRHCRKLPALIFCEQVQTFSFYFANLVAWPNTISVTFTIDIIPAHLSRLINLNALLGDYLYLHNTSIYERQLASTVMRSRGERTKMIGVTSPELVCPLKHFDVKQ